jgi:prevent-host-death family protein
MTTVSVRQTCRSAENLIDRVATGERVIVTRNGRPVAELHRVRPTSLTSAELLRRWRHLPYVDPSDWRRDVDALIDPTV